MKVFKPTAEQNATAAKLIKKYQAKHKKLKEDILPSVEVMSWRFVNNKSDKREAYWYFPALGISGFETKKITKLLNADKAHRRYGFSQTFSVPYAHYDENLKVLHFGLYTIDTSSKHMDQKKPWEELASYYMVENNKAIYDNDGNHVQEDRVHWKLYYTIKFAYTKYGSIKALWNFMAARSYIPTDKSLPEVEKYIEANYDGDLDTLMAQSYQNKLSYYIIGDWSQKSPAYGNKVKTDKLADVKEFLENYNYTKAEFDSETIMCELMYYNEMEIVAFRLFRNTYFWPEKEYKIAEKDRYFIVGDKLLHYTINVTTNNKMVFDAGVNVAGRIYFRNGQVAGLEDALSNSKGNFRYLKTILSDSKNCILDAYNMLRHPEFEQMVKMGYGQIVSKLIAGNEIKQNELSLFGDINKKAKTPWGKYGLNKYQMKALNELGSTKEENRYYVRNYFDYTALGLTMKELLSAKSATTEYVDVSHYDNSSTDAVIEAMKTIIANKMYQYSWWSRNDVYLKNFSYLIPPIQLDNEDKKALILYYTKMQRKTHMPVLRSLSDTISMYNRIREKPTINWMFDSYEAIQREHDRLIQLNQLEQAEQRRLAALTQAERNKQLDEKRKKADAKRKQYNYEDDKYIIRLPEYTAEIVSEGSILSHCVGGYADRHACGSTTILFLRRKNRPDIPWFTIEVNHNRVIQIHGSHNRWLSSDDESYAAVPFVMRWLEKNQIACDDHILLSTATSYAGPATYRAKPQI